MKVTIPQSQLIDWHYEIQQSIIPSKSFRDACLKSKVESFYNENNERIKSIIEFGEKMMKDYFQYEQGRVKFQEVDGIGPDDKPQKQSMPCLLPGKTLEEYQQKINEVMETKIEIIAW